MALFSDDDLAGRDGLAGESEGHWIGIQDKGNAVKIQHAAIEPRTEHGDSRLSHVGLAARAFRVHKHRARVSRCIKPDADVRLTLLARQKKSACRNIRKIHCSAESHDIHWLLHPIVPHVMLALDLRCSPIKGAGSAPAVCDMLRP